jgi:hypothetical protein
LTASRFIVAKERDRSFLFEAEINEHDLCPKEDLVHLVSCVVKTNSNLLYPIDQRHRIYVWFGLSRLREVTPSRGHQLPDL